MSKKQLKVLICQNNKYQSLLIGREIAGYFEEAVITTARSLDEIRTQINHGYFDIILIDSAVAENGIYELISDICKSETRSSVIVITEDRSEKHARELSRAGVEMTLIKDESFYAAIPRMIEEIIGRKVIGRKMAEDKCSNDRADMINITAGTLLHEINNPLMSILGLSELILEDSYNLDRETLKKVRIIQKSAYRIEKTLKNLRKISSPRLKNTVSGQLIEPDLSRKLVAK